MYVDHAAHILIYSGPMTLHALGGVASSRRMQQRAAGGRHGNQL